MTAAKALADKLKAGVLPSGFTRRTLMRKQWHGLTRGEEIDAALGYLVDAKWLREELTASGNGSRSQIYIIN